MPQDYPLVIVGASNLIAPYLIKRLHAVGLVAEVITRKRIDLPEGFTLTLLDLTLARNWIAPENAVVISLLPRWLLEQFLPRFIGVKAVIAVSSTNVLSKNENISPTERKTINALERAEGVLHEWCKRSLVHYTLLRPTMIYDGKTDKNITRVINFIRRFHFLPLAAPAKGLRQPIHADDVARALIAAINNQAAHDRVFNIAGGEILSCRTMAERIFASLKIKPRLLMLPTEWLVKAFGSIERIGLLRGHAFGSAMFQRMNDDQIFDVGEGLKVLNYQPRKFFIDSPNA